MSARPLARGLSDAARAVEVVLEELPTRLEREPSAGAGEGGDETTAIDAAAEAAVVERLEAVEEGFTLVSEELGSRVFGDGGDGLTVVCDPIDGSLNAKRGIPSSRSPSRSHRAGAWRTSSSASSRTSGAARSGWPDAARARSSTAARWTGRARRSGSRSSRSRRRAPIFVAEHVAGMVGLAVRTRVMGSLRSRSATSPPAAWTPSSRSSRLKRGHCRGELLVLERGLAVDLPEDPPFGAAPLDLAARSRVVAAATPALCAELYARLR